MVGLKFKGLEMQLVVDLKAALLRANLEIPLMYLMKIDAVLKQAQQMANFLPQLRPISPYIVQLEQALQRAIDEAKASTQP